jgi:hypothetical protein
MATQPGATEHASMQSPQLVAWYVSDGAKERDKHAYLYSLHVVAIHVCIACCDEGSSVVWCRPISTVNYWTRVLHHALDRTKLTKCTRRHWDSVAGLDTGQVRVSISCHSQS